MKIFHGVKLSYFAWWCQITLFCMMVSNCPRCQIVLGVKLSHHHFGKQNSTLGPLCLWQCFSCRLYVTTTLHVWRLKESAKECDVKSEEASRQVLARNEFETAGVVGQEEEEGEEKGHRHSFPRSPSYYFKRGKMPEKKKLFQTKILLPQQQQEFFFIC